MLGSETIQVDWDSPSVMNGPEAFHYRLFYIKENALEDERETQISVLFDQMIL